MKREIAIKKEKALKIAKLVKKQCLEDREERNNGKSIPGQDMQSRRSRIKSRMQEESDSIDDDMDMPDITESIDYEQTEEEEVDEQAEQIFYRNGIDPDALDPRFYGNIGPVGTKKIRPAGRLIPKQTTTGECLFGDAYLV